MMENPNLKWMIWGYPHDLGNLQYKYKHTKNYGKTPFSLGKSTISMAIFNSHFDITRGYSEFQGEHDLYGICCLGHGLSARPKF